MPTHADPTSSLSAAEIIKLLGLQPHPEGGHFCQTFCDTQLIDGKRPGIDGDLLSACARRTIRTGIASMRSKVGTGTQERAAPHDRRGRQRTIVTLGADLEAGQRPQAIVPAHAWQSAETLGDWTLVGCTVAPGFEWAGFEMAPKDWTPD